MKRTDYFYRCDKGCVINGNMSNFFIDDFLKQCLNDNALIRLIFKQVNGKIVNDLDAHISHKSLSPELLDILHSIQKEVPYIQGVRYNPLDEKSSSEADEFLYNTMVSRYDLIGDYLDSNVGYIRNILNSSDNVKSD